MRRRDFLASVSLLPFLRLPVGRMSEAAVLVPDRPWEGSCAMPFSGGIWKVGSTYRCYYLADYQRVCVAFSEDGLTWTKPDLGIVPGTNILLAVPAMDSFSVWPHQGQWHMTISQRSGGPLTLLTSRNGLWWNSVASMPWAGDRTTLWWNPVKARWTFNVRNGGGTGGDPRRIDRVESETFIPTSWTPEPWLRSDALRDGESSQLYAVDVIPQGDRLLGLFTIWRGQEKHRPKLNDVCVGYSKDGEEWARSYVPILSRSDVPGSWNFGNVQSVGGGLVTIDGETRLYASGRSGKPGTETNGRCSMGYARVTL